MLWFYYIFQCICLRKLHYFKEIGHYIDIEKIRNEEKMKEYVLEFIK